VRRTEAAAAATRETRKSLELGVERAERPPVTGSLSATADPHAAGSALIDHLLTVARDRLGMELSWVSSFGAGVQRFEHVGGALDAFEIRPGDSSPLADSYCLRVADGRLPNVVEDTSSNTITSGLDVTEALGLGSYAGAPIKADGGVVGMLCCVSRGPSLHLDDADVATLELIAQLIGDILTRESPSRRRDRHVTDRILQAIAGGEMTSVLQPIIAIDTGDIVGVEALTRFPVAPARPDVWFDEAASVGLGIELEITAITMALQRLGDLPRQQFMTLNASPSTILDPRLADLLSRAEPSRCVIEVTEHDGVDDYEVLGRSLQTLRDIGVRVAVDDVGAGFASLSRVLEIQPNILKIDRSIVKGIHTDSARQALAQAIMGVAKRLDATVIAEGVESTAELEALAALGVHQAQGFLLGRPQAAILETSRVTVPEFRSAELLLTTSEVDRDLAARRFELAMLHSPVGMSLVSLDGTFINVNPAFASMLGRSEREFDELRFDDITHPDDVAVCRQLLQECLSGRREDYRIEKRYLTNDGSTIWGDVSVVLVKSSDGQPLYFIAQVQDTSARHHRERELATRATTDHLTAIANRSAASEYLESLAANATPFGVLYCDLRNFKTINDTYGHRAGDVVLIAVGQRLKQLTRTSDHVSRWGGDEFLLIIPHATERFLRGLSTRVAAGVAQPISLHPSTDTATPTITIGTACFDPNGSDTVDAVLHRADSHMYDQRDAGLGDQSILRR